MYNFTNGGPSTYKVTPTREAGTFTHVTASGELVSLRADIPDYYSATLTGKLVSPRYVGVNANPPSLDKRMNSFVSCTLSRQTSLKTAAGNAQTYANKAFIYLATTSSTTCVTPVASVTQFK